MELPDLPKKYKRKEAKIDNIVIDWFRDNYPHSCAIEVKIKGNKILPHQELALKEVARGKFSHKIADMGRRNSFDGFTLINAHAFLVTCDGYNCTALNIGTHEEFKFKIKSTRSKKSS